MHKLSFNTQLKQISSVILIITLVTLFFHNTSFSALRAGAAKISITTDKPTELVNDPMHARILVIDDGKTKAIIVAVDILYVQTKLLSEVRARVKNELKLNADNIIINATHNHHENGQTAEDLVDRIVGGIKKANESLVPVKIGTGKGIENRITMNRRLKLKNGKEWTIRRATPTPPDEEVAGIVDAFDPEIGILRIDSKDGKPLAVLYNFAGHAYEGVPNRGASACFPGFASRTIEENLENGAVAMYIQGAAGDITPVLYKDVNAPRPSEELGTKLGLSTLKALKNISTTDQGDIKVIKEGLELPVRKDIQMRIDSLEAQKKVALDYFKGVGCGAHGAGTSLNFKTFLPLYIKYMMSEDYPTDYADRYLQENKIGNNDLKYLDEDNRRDISKYLGNIYTMEKLILIEANLANLRSRRAFYLSVDKPFSEEVVGMKIGDYILVTYPGEIFAQVGLNIKQKSPNKNTYIAGYSNGSVGYSPTVDAYDGEAYEVSLSRLAPEWQNIYEDKVLEIINKLMSK